MKANHTVLILQQSNVLPEQLPEVLHDKGFSPRVIHEFSELRAALKEMADPIVILDCGPDSDRGIETVKRFIDDATLHTLPLLAAGPEIDGVESILTRYFKLSTTVNTPCTPVEMLEAVNYLAKQIERSRSDGKEVSAKETQSLKAVAAMVSSLVQDEVTSKLNHQLYTQIEQVPDLLFEQLTRMGIFNHNLQGATYVKGIDDEYLKNNAFLSSNRRVCEISDSITADAGRWGKGHLQRTLYASCRLLEPFRLPPDQLEHAKAAAQLFSWSLVERDKALLKGEYLSTRSLLTRKDLCSRIKDSAMKIAVDLSLPEVGNIVATLGRQVGHEEEISDKPFSIIASAIMAADLTDRICYQNGHWNPRAAYNFLRKVKSGKIKDLHPSVLACMIKFLSEAIGASPSALVLPKGGAKNKKLFAEAKRLSTIEIAEHEQRVDISALIPGMRLSRPLYSFDGRQVLSADLLLDQDLIWRIWQLAALRPLNGPAIVRSRQN